MLCLDERFWLRTTVPLIATKGHLERRGGLASLQQMDAPNPRRMKFLQRGFLFLTKTTGLERETESFRYRNEVTRLENSVRTSFWYALIGSTGRFRPNRV